MVWLRDMGLLHKEQEIMMAIHSEVMPTKWSLKLYKSSANFSRRCIRVVLVVKRIVSVMFDCSQTNFNTRLRVWKGSCEQLECVGESDDACGDRCVCSVCCIFINF